MSKGCVLKHLRRNVAVYDCQGELRGVEIPPTTPYSVDGVKDPLPSQATIHRTDEDGGIQGAIQRAIADLGGLETYIRPTDNVAMKVNIAGGFPENPASYTNPHVVEILADEIAKVCDPKTKQCAKPYFVEADNNWMDIEQRSDLLEKFGYMDLIDRQHRKGKPNIPFVHLTTGKKWEGKEKLPFTNFVKVKFRDPQDFETDVSSFLLVPTTKIVSLARAKHHQYTGLSLDTKNMYGAYATPRKDRFHAHKNGVAPIIAAAGRVMRPTLTLTDFDPMCVGWFGPNFCGVHNDHKIVMSNDLVCGENVGRELAGLPKDAVIHLKINETLQEGNPQCNLAQGSMALQDAKNPEIMNQAPPQWWYSYQESTLRKENNIPREVVDLLGRVTYSATRLINLIAVGIYQRIAAPIQ